MVRINFVVASALAVASFIAPGAFACENECRLYPVRFLTDKYTNLLQTNLATLNGPDRTRAEPLLAVVLSRLPGRNGAIDQAIFSKFHVNCRDMPPHRSPDEICGSAKSIACYTPWKRRNSVFARVHARVVNVLEDVFRRTDGEVWQVMVEDVRSACPDQCGDWEQPFQTTLLQWEEREHHDVYKGHMPSCEKDGL
ncbi:hypothetical protein EDD21DRAFT_409131 [Dissophora ornata]|nr:hypothetical protein BGZ58_006904 [Dissophora ornata]KAI8595396.1 hypothetical protein EDD21DRAFT_409131 [Dissophora ornata]